MNLRRILSQAALVVGALVFSIGLQAFAASFAQPSSGPTGGNAVAPLDTGATTNYKSGQLFVNIDSGGNIGSASNGLVVGGNIDATNDVCIQPPGGGSPLCLSSLTGGGGNSFWGGSQSGDISNTNSGNVNINSGGCYYKFQNGALHTNCDVTHDVIPASVTFSGSLSGFAGASNHCLETDGSHIYYDAWCGNRYSGPITISGCTISGSPLYFGNTGDPAGTLTVSGNSIIASNGASGSWTYSCTGGVPLTGNLNIVGGGGGCTISGSGGSLTVSCSKGGSGKISVAPQGNQNVLWDTKGTQLYSCPNAPDSYQCGTGTVTCTGQITTASSCNGYQGYCSFGQILCGSLGYLVQ